ncbi:AI-2E family transporter [Evansella clarkii]|uniref:AI-2E family transporter n=1 Tax=Evansella clarkii TaxID=79879 RepID=UPI000996F769|nr:AI-2E family transporter [Evansella clarkii]
MFHNKLFQTGIGVIILFLIIYLGTLIDWLFQPVLILVQTLFVPVLLAGVLFYLFRPVVRLLDRKIPRTLSIIIIYLGFTGLLVSVFSLIVPEVRDQFLSLMDNLPMVITEIQILLAQIQQSELIHQLDLTENFILEDQLEQLGSMVNSFVRGVTTNVVSFLGAVVNFLLLFFIVPFILFYMLKEGEKFPERIVQFFNRNQQDEVRKIMHALDEKLSSYIKGVLIVCSFIGVLCYISFTIIGLDYALILALIAMVTNVIPYLGPWIGAVPAVIVGLLHSPFMALLVIIVIVIVQQLESILIQPQVMGKQMKMHPVTVLFLVLVAGRFAGIVGMILAVPAYAVGKVIVSHLYRIWKLRQREA